MQLYRGFSGSPALHAMLCKLVCQRFQQPGGLAPGEGDEALAHGIVIYGAGDLIAHSAERAGRGDGDVCFYRLSHRAFFCRHAEVAGEAQVMQTYFFLG